MRSPQEPPRRDRATNQLIGCLAVLLAPVIFLGGFAVAFFAGMSRDTNGASTVIFWGSLVVAAAVLVYGINKFLK
jgi:hypothetical protein